MTNQTQIRSDETRERGGFGAIIHNIVNDIERIVRAEIRLARTELDEKAARIGKVGGVMGAAAGSGLLAGASFVAACIAGLALVLPVWLAAATMGFLLAIAAAGCYAFGRNRLLQINPAPEQTIHSMKDNIAWLKRRTES